MEPEPPAYVVDTSAWVDLRKVMVVPGLWDRLDGLVVAGRLILPWEVCVELDPYPDPLDKWVRAQEGCHRDTVEQWNLAQTIADRYPDLVNYAKPKGSADCFVIAAAIIERDTPVLMPRQVIVVANETSHAPGRISIPDACNAEHLTCMNVSQWFTYEGWGV
jgi:hypothetical protein